MEPLNGERGNNYLLYGNILHKLHTLQLKDKTSNIKINIKKVSEGVNHLIEFLTCKVVNTNIRCECHESRIWLERKWRWRIRFKWSVMVVNVMMTAAHCGGVQWHGWRCEHRYIYIIHVHGTPTFIYTQQNLIIP